MSAKKRNRGDTNEMEESSESEDMMSEEEQIDEEVQVDFEARTPTDSDFRGLVRLLKQLFLKASVDTSQMADIIIQNNSISSVIKQCELSGDSDDDADDETYGLISVINLNVKDKICVKEICTLLLEKSKSCAKGEESNALNNLFGIQSKNIGLILSERFVNIPAQISLPMFETLSKELKDLQKKSSRHKYTDFLVISKMYKMDSAKPTSNSAASYLYSNAEDEILSECGNVLFDYGVEDESAAFSWDKSSAEMNPYRRVIHLPYEKLDFFISKLRDELNQ